MAMPYPGWFKHSDTERHPLVGKYIKVWWGGAEAGRILPVRLKHFVEGV